MIVLALTDEEIKNASAIFDQYTYDVNHASKNTNITINNGQMSFLINGKNEMDGIFSSYQLKIHSMIYGGKIFDEDMMKISPLEADRNSKNWDKYYSCDFMKIMPLAHISLLKYHTLFDWCDFACICANTYLEIVPAKEVLKDRSKKLKCKDIEYKNVGKTFRLPNGRKITNHIVRFKPKFAQYFKDTIPYNEFTNEMYFNRIRKAYPSLVRDIYQALRGPELDPSSTFEYSLRGDMKGWDLKINGICICAFANTAPSKQMKCKKDNERHLSEMPEKRIHLIKNIEYGTGIQVLSDDILLKVIEATKTHDFNKEPCLIIYG